MSSWLQLGSLSNARGSDSAMSLEQPLLSGEDSGLQVGYGKSTSEEPEQKEGEGISPA